MILRDYQLEAVDFLTYHQCAMVVAPAGSGKTVIAAAALARVARSGMRVVWIAPTIEMVEQAGAALAQFEGPQDVDFDVCCAAACPDVSRADVLVLDEAHHSPAVQTYLPAAREARGIVWGITATPWHPDEERNVIVREVFQNFHTIERDRILASGHLVGGKVWMHDLDRAGEFDAEIEAKTRVEVARRVRAFREVPIFEHERRAKYQFTQESIQANETRNRHAIGLACQERDLGSSVLMLVFSIEHGEKLAAQISGAVLVHSKLAKKKRAQIISDFRAGLVPVLVATSLADEGLDVPRAEVLILVAGGRSATKLEQRAGRVLRPFADKTGGRIHDFVDRGATFAYAQSRARMRVYEQLGYEPDIIPHDSFSGNRKL